jgi:hypothetical protein
MKKIMGNKWMTWTFFLVFICTNPDSIGFSQEIKDYNDFSASQIVISQDLSQLSQTEQAVLEMLVEEVEKRTTIELTTTVKWPDSSTPVIAVGIASSFTNKGPFKDVIVESSTKATEGFNIKVINNGRKAPTIFIIGNDARGMLFGVGYFLRKISMQPGKILVPNDLNIDTHPMVALRGHQLGYRPKTNSYDGFTEAMWEQYIRDLIVFGTNSIELLPDITDDRRTSPMFPLPQMEMMIRMSKILAKYDLNVWIWYPQMFGDYTRPENVERAMEDNRKIFSQLPKIDAIFVPGGDPGNLPPTVLFSYMEKEARLLRQYHPKAEMWVSPQGFNGEEMDEFIQLLKKEPEWLTGVVHGPQIFMDVNELRKVVPAKYPIRQYPDITHSLDSQYPVDNWDFAFAATENRECINPRPVAESYIFHADSMASKCGFITYSEGVNDDVNKIVWSGLGWNPKADLREILQDYSRYFIGPDYAYDFAQGLFDLEQNWNGPLLGNTLVYNTLYKFQSMERRALPDVRLNWRFQQALFRAYYDAYIRSRLIYETQLEDEAMNLLRKASEMGSLVVMEQAEDILDKAKLINVAEDWRQRVFELAEALFQSIHMQLSVQKYFASSVDRGANLDLISYSFNDRIWLEEQFARIARIDNEQNRLNEIEKITNWKNPGPGGFYDDLGDLGNQPHIVMEKSYKDDPSFYHSPFAGFSRRALRLSWGRYMQTLFGHPLKMHYSNLDKTAQYEVKVTYISTTPIRLIADEDMMIHDYTRRAAAIGPVSFDIPLEATQDGDLTLKWNMETGRGGAGRGCQIAEVWLIKKPILSVSPVSLKLGSAFGSTGNISVTSNTTWSVTDDATWLSVSPTSGSGNGSVIVTSRENTAVNSRSATITFSAAGVSSVTATVIQSAAKRK